MAVSFIGVGNRSTREKPTDLSQTLSHNVVSSTSRHERGLKSQLALITQVVVNPTTIQSRPRCPPFCIENPLQN